MDFVLVVHRCLSRCVKFSFEDYVVVDGDPGGDEVASGFWDPAVNGHADFGGGDVCGGVAFYDDLPVDFGELWFEEGVWSCRFLFSLYQLEVFS